MSPTRIQMWRERHSDVQGTTRHTFRCAGNDTTRIQMCRERHDTHSAVQGTTRHAFRCAENDTTRIQMCRERHVNDTHSELFLFGPQICGDYNKGVFV